MERELPRERLLAVIETQNEIAATAHGLDAVMATVVARARELVGAQAGVVELLEGEEMVCHVASGSASAQVGLRVNAGASLSGPCVQRGEIQYCEDAAGDERLDPQACKRIGAVSIVSLPLSRGERVVGALTAYDPRPRAFDAADLRTLELLAGVIAAHMARSSGHEAQHHAGQHDALTGLRNRRGFDDRLATETARVRRHGYDFTLCLLHLHGLEKIDDTLGHAAAAEVLRAFARHVSEVRGEDATFRLGEEEFALMLVGAAAEDARAVIERIDQTVREDPACRAVGVSWGIATLTDNDPVSMIQRADAALRDAERARAC